MPRTGHRRPLRSFDAAAHPDETQFDPSSPCYDATATRDDPRWLHVDAKLVDKTRLVGRAEWQFISPKLLKTEA